MEHRETWRKIGMDHSEHHEHNGHGHHHGNTGMRGMAASATLHCLAGCAIGEILGMVIGTAMGLATIPTVLLAISLAFLFGYILSTLPLLKAGLPIATALSIVLAAFLLGGLTVSVYVETNPSHSEDSSHTR